MKTLVVGASGATGKLLVEQLINRGLSVKIIVRSLDKLPEIFKNHDRLTIIKANILNLSDTDIARHINGCDAVASCLGHNISWKGIFGPPHRLVSDVTRRLCNAIKANKQKEIVKFVLMNTTANSNRDIHESQSFGEKCIFGFIRLLLPPQVDNEKAAEYLRIDIGQNDRFIEWAVVRPDTLINEDKVTEYNLYSSPIRSPIFNAGSTSRINVGHFMADLITDDAIWRRWKGKMPVIYNQSSLQDNKGKSKHQTA
jgi:nucleoside-diphosphate-sugar epimerase